MARRLLVDGTVQPDGTPNVLPRGAWVPSWAGGTRVNPGESLIYSGDRKSGVQRILQRPRSLYVPRGVQQDVSELAAPLSRIGKAGLLFGGGRQNIMPAGQWDLTTWSQVNSAVTTGGEEGPTGETSGMGQAYLVDATALTNGQAAKNQGSLNVHTDTYVASVWARLPAGWTQSDPFELRWTGGTLTNIEVTLTEEWQRVSLETATAGGATSKNFRIVPGTISGTGKAIVWGPVIENQTGAGNTERAAGTAVEPQATRVIDKLSGPFAFPSPPWTMYLRFTPFWGAADGLDHDILQVLDAAANSVFLVTKESTKDDLQVTITDRDGTNQVIGASPSLNQREEWRIIIKHGTDGSLSGWLNETAFATQKSSGVYGPSDGATLTVGNVTSTKTPDFILHQLEVWDEDIPETDFYGLNAPIRRAT